MSQCYRVELKSSVCHTVRAADRVTHSLDLTSILPREQMVDLLREALLRRGFEAAEGGSKLSKKGSAGEEIVFDLEKLEVSAEISDAKDLTAEVKASATGASRGRAKAAAEKHLRDHEAAALREMGATERQLEKELTRRLEESEPARERELNATLQEVYAESLKRKARQLGDVLSVSESTSAEGEYELVIKVAR